jgi:hypothetical protein
MQLEPMGVGDILDAAFRLCRRRFATFMGISAVVCVPSSFATAVLMGAARALAPFDGADDEGLLNVLVARLADGRWAVAGASGGLARSLPGGEGLGMSVLSLVASIAMIVIAFSLVLSIAYPLCTGALVVNISASYLGEDLGAGQSYTRAFHKLWRLLMAQAWTTLLVLLGLCLCVVPGIVLLVQLSLVPEVVLLEDQRAWPAIGRSRSLMTDNLGKAVLLGAVVWLLGLVFGAVVSTAVHWVPWPYPIIADFLSYLIVELVMLPLSIATVVLLYYDLRIRKESFGLQHLASAMDAFQGK